MKRINYQIIQYPETIFIYNLYVKPEYRNRHLPKKLFRYLINKYHKSIMLECKEELLQYYLHLGFKIVEDKDINNKYLIEYDSRRNRI